MSARITDEEALAYKFQSIMAQKLTVDQDGDIAGVGPASFAMARLALSTEPGEAEGWQPIKTAPRDQEVLIAYWRWRNSMSQGSVVVQSASLTEHHGPGIWSWVVSDNKHGPFPIRGWSDGDMLAGVRSPPHPSPRIPIMAGKLTEIEQALRAGMDAASKGAWQEGAGWVFIDPIDPERNPTHALRNLLRDVPDEELQANVKHIVAAQPDNIRALLDELSRLREALEWIAREAPQPTGADTLDAVMRFVDLQNYASATLARAPFVSHEDGARALSEREGQE